jgi:hypothetical protein
MDATTTTSERSPVLVAIASWLVPGLGYWMIGQRQRALTIGISIVSLFLAGLLIGGIRVLDVPGYNQYGQPIRVVNGGAPIMAVNPWQEIRNKPWSIAQILAGPISIFSGAGSVIASQPTHGSHYDALAEVSHTPVNEAGTLYTSVAGMLNLLAIIDAAYRATERREA